MPEFSSGLIVLVLLLLLNGLLSAARAALMNASRARLRQLIAENIGGADLALKVSEDATPLLATSRLAQTFCRFGVAGLSALLFAVPLAGAFRNLSPLTPQADAIAFFIVLLLATMLVISVGEFFPESLAMRSPETTAIFFAPWMAALEWALSPVVRLTLWLSERVNGPVGHRASLVTEEEIKTMVDAGEEGGAIEEDEKEMIYSVLEISDTWAREIMVPRIDVFAIDVETPMPEAVQQISGTGHSRIPVYQENIDNLLGMLYIKDLLRVWTENPQNINIRSLLRPAYFIPETKKVNDLLTELQQQRIHMAIVVDEYGGTAGIVTLEDIVEEIVGEIRDEYDINEESYFEKVNETEYIFDARINLDEVNDLLQIQLPTDDSDSLGGYIYSQLGRVPTPAEKVATSDVEFTVLTVTGRRIRKVRGMKVLPPVDEVPSEDEPALTDDDRDARTTDEE